MQKEGTDLAGYQVKYEADYNTRQNCFNSLIHKTATPLPNDYSTQQDGGHNLRIPWYRSRLHDLQIIVQESFFASRFSGYDKTQG